MEKHISLSLLNPCSEQWGSFSATSQGAFCGTCQKNVIDFTGMSDGEIATYFTTHRSSMCGRFRSNQLKSYPFSGLTDLRPGIRLLSAGIFGLILMLASPHIQAQTVAKADAVQAQSSVVTGPHVIVNEFTVQGVVLDENDQPLPGVNIYLKSYTNSGTFTDAEGKFIFPGKVKAGEVVMFSFLGYVPFEYTVPDKEVPSLTIRMVVDTVPILGEVSVNEVYGSKPSGISRLFKRVKDLF